MDAMIIQLRIPYGIVVQVVLIVIWIMLALN